MSREHGVQRYNCGQYEKGFMSRTLFRSHILMHAQVNMLMLFDAVLMSHNPSMLKHDKVIYFNARGRCLVGILPIFLCLLLYYLHTLKYEILTSYISHLQLCIIIYIEC
jgi:hypothetical protein